MDSRKDVMDMDMNIGRRRSLGVHLRGWSCGD